MDEIFVAWVGYEFQEPDEEHFHKSFDKAVEKVRLMSGNPIAELVPGGPDNWVFHPKPKPGAIKIYGITRHDVT